MIESGNLSSFILWGPPGVGKTTLSRIVAKSLGREFYTLSAVSAGVKDVRDVIDKARSNSLFSSGLSPILFVDLFQNYRKLGFRYAETNANLETNAKVQAMWEPFEREIHKRRWIFGKDI